MNENKHKQTQTNINENKQTLTEQYKGVYLILEKIEQGPNRVNIQP